MSFEKKNLLRMLALMMVAAAVLASITATAEGAQRRKKRKPKEPIPYCATVVCTSVTASKQQLDYGERTTLQANAADPDGDPLTYTWIAPAGTFEGDGATVTYIAPTDSQGAFTITAQINDGFGHTVECSITLQVGPDPRQP